MGLLGWIGDWIKQGLVDGIMAKFANLFDTVNEQVGGIAAEVGKTPEGWNSSIFNMIKNLSETIIVPIAGIILTFVLTYELIQMIMERNNMHEFDIFNIYKWILKTFIAVYILTNCFTIVMAIFEIAQTVVDSSATLIGDSLDIDLVIDDLENKLKAMGLWELIGLWLETHIVGICMSVLSVVIFVVTFGRMIEIYLVVSIAPIPVSTMANREWGMMGQNYLRSLFAVAFQGFLLMVCVAIYAALVQSIPSADNMHAAIWGTAGYTALLAFAMFKTGSLAKGVFNAHG